MNPNDQIFPKIKRAGVSEEIMDMIQEAMMTDKLRPGDRLPTETELSEQLGISRNAVREAMKMLSALGVIDIRRGDGTYITEELTANVLNPIVFTMLLKTKTTRELVELRTMIESGYCQLAATNATGHDLELIEQAKVEWENHAKRSQPDIEELAQLDLNFHYAILDATHNSLVITLGQMVERLYLSSIRDAMTRKEVVEWGFKGHQSILDALRTRDTLAICEAVEYSLTYWRDIFGQETGNETLHATDSARSDDR